MQTLILQSTNLNDLLIIMQLAQRLGITYTQKEVEMPLLPPTTKIEKSTISTTLKKLNRPIRKKLDIEELKKEQNYQGADKNKIQHILNTIAIEEPLEDLLAQLKA
jgi:hypothetical protein